MDAADAAFLLASKLTISHPLLLSYRVTTITSKGEIPPWHRGLIRLCVRPPSPQTGGDAVGEVGECAQRCNAIQLLHWGVGFARQAHAVG